MAWTFQQEMSDKFVGSAKHFHPVTIYTADEVVFSSQVNRY
ncbi:hypothetical protein [Lentilactobacillus buchneri]|nr:hypothetical protein [Lentilactobacillus buchneri]MDS1014769.1 hypothetical protein [Lentilactobacillus buchneri]